MHMVDFAKGKKIVYPNQGICVSEGICERTILGEKQSFYSFVVEANGARVMVPKNQAKSVGIRPLISKKESKKIMSVLGTCDGERAPQNWKIRFEGNSNLLNSGSIYDTVSVLKCLALVQTKKTLSFREQEMYTHALWLIVSEVAAATGDTDDAVGHRVEKALESFISVFEKSGN